MPHQPLPLGDLPWAEFVLFSFKGIVAGFEFEFDRRAFDVLWSMADAMYMAYINEMPPYFNSEQ